MNDKQAGDEDINSLLELVGEMETSIRDGGRFPSGDYCTHIFDDVSNQIREFIPTMDTEKRNLSHELGDKFAEASKRYSKSRKELENHILEMRVIVEKLGCILPEMERP